MRTDSEDQLARSLQTGIKGFREDPETHELSIVFNDGCNTPVTRLEFSLLDKAYALGWRNACQAITTAISERYLPHQGGPLPP